MGVSELCATQNSRNVFPAGKSGRHGRLPGIIHGEGVFSPPFPQRKCEKAQIDEAKKRGGNEWDEAHFDRRQSTCYEMPNRGMQHYLGEPYIPIVPRVMCNKRGSQLDVLITRTTMLLLRKRSAATCKQRNVGWYVARTSWTTIWSNRTHSPTSAPFRDVETATTDLHLLSVIWSVPTEQTELAPSIQMSTLIRKLCEWEEERTSSVCTDGGWSEMERRGRLPESDQRRWIMLMKTTNRLVCSTNSDV